MQTLSWIKGVGVAMLLGIATPVFAESAPVYDADTMQQQADNSDQAQAQDYPPPPPPGQEGAFVPMQGSGAAPSPSPSAQASPPLPLEQRMRKVEQQVVNLQTNDAPSRLESLQNQVQSLRAQVEQMTHQLQQLQSQQKNMYSDLDKRVEQSKPTMLADSTTDTSNLNMDDVIKPAKTKKNNQQKLVAANDVSSPDSSQSNTNTQDAAPKTVDNQPNVAEEQQIYQTAYNLIKAKKYTDAVDALQKMLQKYPSGQFASNAHYWLGELYGLLGKNDQSLTEFSSVVSNYPSSPRVSDAQLKIGLIYASQSKWLNAKTAFKRVINHYPGTASSRLASEQLKQIKQAGH